MSETDDDESPPPDKPFKKAAWARGAEASSLGIEIAVSVCVPMIGAYYLEKHVTHWSPWTTLIGFAFGMLVAGNAIARTARTYQASLKADAQSDEPPKAD